MGITIGIALGVCTCAWWWARRERALLVSISDGTFHVVCILLMGLFLCAGIEAQQSTSPFDSPQEALRLPDHPLQIPVKSRYCEHLIDAATPSGGLRFTAADGTTTVYATAYEFMQACQHDPTIGPYCVDGYGVVGRLEVDDPKPCT